ncbi:hypothetical protein P9027_32260, partial [Bacillus thuringiensis]|uniref:hypothetical protein n=1 Tax=Bacillus thuringiensis TaxID=1428 RepID=UPI002DBC3D76
HKDKQVFWFIEWRNSLIWYCSNDTFLIEPITIIVGAAVILVVSCLSLRKDKRKRVAFDK